MCSGLPMASNRRWRGPSNRRVMRISRSDGVVTAKLPLFGALLAAIFFASFDLVPDRDSAICSRPQGHVERPRPPPRPFTLICRTYVERGPPGSTCRLKNLHHEFASIGVRLSKMHRAIRLTNKRVDWTTRAQEAANVKYMLMMHAPRAGWTDAGIGTWPPEDFKAHIAFMMRFNK